MSRWYKLGMAAVLIFWCAGAWAGDWPTYRHDRERSGLTDTAVPLPAAVRWTFTPQAPPRQAWSGPRDEPVEGNWEMHRVDFDAANHLVVAGDRVFFGSSGDCRVYCLDAATGRLLWSYLCGGPVRLAPTVYEDRVYFGSDDGHAYCLSAADGSLVWQFAAGRNDELCLANGRMVSRWPLRTDVLVDGGVAYFGAGVFPHDGVYVYALDARTGQVIWVADTISQGNAGRNDFSPQGYILASDTRLFVPAGRDLPAAFDRQTGQQIFKISDSWRASNIVGGSFALLHGEHLLVGANQAVAYSQETGRGGFAWFPARRLVVGADKAWMSTRTQVSAVSFEGYAEATRLIKAQERKQAAALDKLSVLRRTLATEKRKPADQQNATYLADLEKQIAAAQADLDAIKAELERLQAQNVQPSTLWTVDRVCEDELIVAGDVVFGGGVDKVYAFAAETGAELWSADIEGRARSLAVAGDSLYVATTTGKVYAFGAATAAPTANSPAAPPPPTPDPNLAAAAEAIVAHSGVTRGYCLVLGAVDGRLGCEIARRTDLLVYCLCPDDRALQRVRRTADAAGLYGSRVWAERGSPSHMRFSSYFANLTVCESLLVDGSLPEATPELVKRIKPCGGVVCVGLPPGVPNAGVADFVAWTRSLGLGEPRVVTERGRWALVTRGALPGAGDWTHQYADPGNTTCSTDTIVKAPFRLLWYGDPGPDKMISRHARSTAPLVVNGRFFAQGYDLLMCYDAYNGVKYWEREIPGAMRGSVSHIGSNICANQDYFFAAIGGRCLKLDPETGETVFTYDQPEPRDPLRFWGWVATVGDLLFGTTGTAEALDAAGAPRRYSADSGRSTRIFALDLNTGRPRWVHDATGEIRNITISIGDGKVFFADSAVTDEEKAQALAPRRAALEQLTGPERDLAQQRLDRAEVVKAFCLDAQTGQVIWAVPVDVTDCGGMSSLLITLYKNGVLVFCGAHGNGHYWHQFLAGEYGDRRVVALDASDGHVLWQKAIGYRIRPLIVGDWLVAEPWAFDLRTGEQRMRTHPLTGEPSPWQFERPGHHCGCISANPNTLFFRSWSFGYYDLINDYGTAHSAAQRPGCWINFLPAAGLVVMPEASSGCQCLFAIMCTSVFEPYEGGREWGLFSAPPPHRPIREAHIDLGGPGDRRDDAGNLWLSYPRPSARMQVPLEMTLVVDPKCGWFRREADAIPVSGTQTPWLYATGVAGITRLTMPLLEAGSEPMSYSVRLHFADLANTRPGQRVFDVRLQGRTVLEALDLARETGGVTRAVVKQFDSVPVRNALEIEFVPRTPVDDPRTAPLLNAIELKGSPLPEMQVQVGSFEVPMEVYNFGYWYADLLRERLGANIVLVPRSAICCPGDSYPAGPITLGRLLASVQDTRLVRYSVSGQALLDYLSRPWVADRLNPYHHPRSSTVGNPLYYSGLTVRYDPAARRPVLDINPAQPYTVLAPWPLAGEPPSLPPAPEELQSRAGIPGLQAQSAEVLPATTWQLLEELARAGSLTFTRRYDQPAAEWTVWREQSEQDMGFGLTQWPADKPSKSFAAVADASVRLSAPDANFGTGALSEDGGDQTMGDSSYGMVYLRFEVDVPGRPLMAKLRLRVAAAPNSDSADAGDVYLAEDPWDEATITFNNRPTPVERVGALGAVKLDTVEERLLLIDLRGRREITLVIKPTSTDAATFLSRESADPPQLFVAYEPQ